MNEDFNYRPRQNSDQSSDPQPQQTQPQDQPAAAPAEPVETVSEPVSNEKPVVTTSARKSEAGKKFLTFLSVLLLLALVAGGVYFWQQTKVDGLVKEKNDLNSKVASLQASKDANADEDKPTTSTGSATTTTYNIITVSPTNVTGTGADISLLYLPAETSEVWIEYGIKPDDLKQTTAKTKVSSAGTPGEYGSQAFALTGLQGGTRYYYRAVGTIGDKTVYGGITAFSTIK